jgi:hypothetical protein
MIESSFYSLQNIKVIQGDFSSIYEWKKIYIYFSVNFHKRKISKTSTSRYFFFGEGWDKLGSWVSYGSWIYNYLCNQCLSPPKLLIRIPPMVCQFSFINRWKVSLYNFDILQGIKRRFYHWFFLLYWDIM